MDVIWNRVSENGVCKCFLLANCPFHWFEGSSNWIWKLALCSLCTFANVLANIHNTHGSSGLAALCSSRGKPLQRPQPANTLLTSLIAIHRFLRSVILLVGQVASDKHLSKCFFKLLYTEHLLYTGQDWPSQLLFHIFAACQRSVLSSRLCASTSQDNNVKYTV